VGAMTKRDTRRVRSVVHPVHKGLIRHDSMTDWRRDEAAA
jgi:hypothetical protein